MQRAVEPPYYYLTEAALEDELYYVLSSKNECDVTIDENGKWFIHPFHPYINQAEGLLYKINLYQPLPKFVIFPEDVPLGLAREIQDLGKVTMNKVVTNAIRRLYESVDFEYYHKNGIHGKVQWETTSRK